MIAYKIIDYNNGNPQSMAGKVLIPMNLGQYDGEPLYFSLTKQYVIDYYVCNNTNILLTIRFNPSDVIWGNLTDRETEFTLSKFTIIKKEFVTDDGRQCTSVC